MEFILRLQCDDVLGAKIERETPTGLVTIATAAPQGESLEVHLLDSPANAGLEFLNGLRARDDADVACMLRPEWHCPASTLVGRDTGSPVRLPAPVGCADRRHVRPGAARGRLPSSSSLEAA